MVLGDHLTIWANTHTTLRTDTGGTDPSSMLAITII